MFSLDFRVSSSAPISFARSLSRLEEFHSLQLRLCDSALSLAAGGDSQFEISATAKPTLAREKLDSLRIFLENVRFDAARGSLEASEIEKIRNENSEENQNSNLKMKKIEENSGSKNSSKFSSTEFVDKNNDPSNSESRPTKKLKSNKVQN